MSAATRRAASLIVGMALTFTPGVVLACAALLCAPSGHHAAVAPGAVRDQQAAAEHEHHHQGAAGVAVAEPRHDHGGHAPAGAGTDAPAFSVTQRVDVLPHGCCTSSGPQWAEPALLASRIDTSALIDTFIVMPARESERDVAVTASGHPPHPLPRHRSTSTRVLRI